MQAAPLTPGQKRSRAACTDENTEVASVARKPPIPALGAHALPGIPAPPTLPDFFSLGGLNMLAGVMRMLDMQSGAPGDVGEAAHCGYSPWMWLPLSSVGMMGTPELHARLTSTYARARTWAALSIHQRVQALQFRLRQAHHYCPYCDKQFANKAAMEAGCPGATLSAHQAARLGGLACQLN